jgi:short subunit dehydrogenase-like uncharacterized protein
MKREFDVVIWGASGFTGRLVAEYLCEAYGFSDQVRWAIAGRSIDKLKEVRAHLATINPKANSLDCIVADSFDAEMLRAMAGRTKVICTTVGPYMKFGMDLVSACVDKGTHYCDLTGETPFIRSIIDQFHDSAKEQKVKLVHSCGYDSIPSDLGVLFVQHKMLELYQSYATEVRFYVGPTKGGVSGGTVASMIGILEKVSDKRIRRILGNPYALNPKDNYKGPDKADQTTVRFDKRAKKWTAPFLMAGINTRIVRRTHALQAYEYGPSFRYSEVMGFRPGLKGWWNATKVTVFIGGIVTIMVLPWFRSLLQRKFLPKPGQGPSENKRKNGYFTIYLLAFDGENEITATIKDSLDPGYGSTAKMLAESALTLALEDESTPRLYGSVTPASALGFPLIKRLQQAGMSFSITEKNHQM